MASTDRQEVVVFTGALAKQTRKEATAEAEARGYVVGSTVTKATTILVCGERAGKKMEDARKKGITVYTEAAWAEIIRREQATLMEDMSNSVAMATLTVAVTETTAATTKTAKRKAGPGPDSEEAAGDEEGIDGEPSVVVFTGALVHATRKEATKVAEGLGFRVEPRLTKSTNILVCGENAGQKRAAAEKQGNVQILTEDEWTTKLTGITGKKSKRAKTSITLTTTTTMTQQAAVSGETSYDPVTGAVNGVLPKTLIADGTIVDVKSKSSNSTYTAKRTGTVYTCNCPAWRNQKVAPTTRTCKHLRELLGDTFEDARAGGSAAISRQAKPTASRKMTAPDVLLAKKWEREKHDPVSWWISEKLDGVRAYWSGSKRVFLSRLGNTYPAPDWFTKGLPDDLDLDGELFGGRARFQFTVGIAKTDQSPDWDQLVYKVFDVPSLKKEPFEKRMARAQTLVQDMDSKYVDWVEHTQCQSLEHLDTVFDEIEKVGGEGLMIREPKSLYAGGRSSSLLKIKSFHDGEAVVIAYEDGKGKYQGMCGALRCKMASGKMFKVASGLSDEQRESPPAIGAIIVYKCQELTVGGIPRFPVFVGIAADKDKPSDPTIANAIALEE